MDEDRLKYAIAVARKMIQVAKKGFYFHLCGSLFTNKYFYTF